MILLCIQSSLDAHDYWMSPLEYHVDAGAEVPVRLFVGDHFNPEIERPLQKNMTVAFALHRKATKPVSLVDPANFDMKPVAGLHLKHSGVHLLSMQRDWAVIEMTGPKFHQYLEHEGLISVIEQRKKAGEADKTATERYRRYLKSLLVVGNEMDDTWKRQLGHKLEIIPLSNPLAAKPGDKVAFKVLLDGKALVNVQTAAMGRDGEKVTDVHAKTDNKGVVTYQLSHSGEWVVRLVHLRKCKVQDEIDYESFWSAITFGVK
ncbi:MAG: DUF4198 domain-containing protein [Pirellulaceae bacterium]